MLNPYVWVITAAVILSAAVGLATILLNDRRERRRLDQLRTVFAADAMRMIRAEIVHQRQVGGGLHGRPAAYCGDLKPKLLHGEVQTDCILRLHHTGRHADEHGSRWARIPTPQPATIPAERGLPEGALDAAVTGANMLDAYAITATGRNFLAHALTEIARAGWLRHRATPAAAWDPHDTQKPEPAPKPADPTDQA